MSIALVPTFGWPPYLQTKQAADYIQVSKHRLYRLVARGELTPIARRGRVMVFAREALDAYLLGSQAQRTPASAPSALRIVDESENA